MSTSLPYKENLLHWLWKNRYLKAEKLSTKSGKEILVHHPGYLNKTDGPDFTNARVTIGSLKWHGDIEIHWKASDWNSHNHQSDTNYNRVILHVVFDDANHKSVQRQDGTIIPTLYMNPFLPKPLQYFLKHFQKPNTLPCAGNIADVPESIIAAQFDHAHSKYFDQKVNDLLGFFDASLPISRAWKQMLIIGLFDGLGIRHNRAPMRRLACDLLENEKHDNAVEATVASALRISGIKPSKNEEQYSWKYKGSRPANHPENRIRQACYLLNFIKNKPLKWWLRTDITKGFDDMLQQVPTTPGIGTNRAGVLLGVIWTQAFYLLGDLTGNRRLTSEAKKVWDNHRTALPQSIMKPFTQSGFPSSPIAKKLGTVHQYRAFCKPHQCERCEVFKFIISS